MKLTKRVVDAIIYRGSKGSRDVRWDGDVKGFGLRIYPDGKKAFVVSYRINGRKRLMTLGAYGVLTLDQARDKAKVALAKVVEGRDPLGEKQAKDREGTVKVLCADYLERHAKLKKRTWRQDDRRINGRILPAWGNLKVSAITSADVAALHHKVSRDGGPYEANLVARLVSKMFGLARKWGYLPPTAPNPATGIDYFAPVARDRWVQPHELPRLAAALKQEKNPYLSAAVWLLLLTGMRKSELLNAKWSDVDPDRRELRLPTTKQKKVHYVPLSDRAWQVLEALPRQEGNPYILCGRLPGSQLGGFRKAWDRIRQRAKLDDVRVHDLRRTCGSWMASAGESLTTIGATLGHSDPRTTRIYARIADQEKRRALEANSQRLLAVAEASDSPIAIANPAVGRRPDGRPNENDATGRRQAEVFGPPPRGRTATNQ